MSKERNIDLPPFYVGQRIVAIRNHSSGDFKIGQEFTVHKIKKGCCFWVLSIGLFDETTHVVCATCKKSTPTTNGENWYTQRMFAPIQEQEFKQTTYTKILEEIVCCDN